MHDRRVLASEFEHGRGEEGSGRVAEVVMDGETAETLVGVVRLRQGAGQLAWVRAEGEVRGRRGS
jgi:hypothetical protein